MNTSRVTDSFSPYDEEHGDFIYVINYQIYYPADSGRNMLKINKLFTLHPQTQIAAASQCMTPKHQLFMFPFAGGNVYSYQPFLSRDPARLELLPIESPGHGRRISEPLLTDGGEIANDYFLQIRQRLNRPYSLYGHSLGAACALLVASRIQSAGLPMPSALFLSGRNSLVHNRDEEQYHRLPSAAFWQKIESLGGVPKALLEEKELKDFFEPILRADFQASEMLTDPGIEKIKVPFFVYLGDKDCSSSKSGNWATYASQEVHTTVMNGDHFFIFDHIDPILDDISRKTAIPA